MDKIWHNFPKSEAKKTGESSPFPYQTSAPIGRNPA